MNTIMNLISVVPFLLFAVAGSRHMRELQEMFSMCRSSLDAYSTTDCQRAQNIHFCTELLNGRIGSRGNQELDRLKCTEPVKSCKTSNIQGCMQRRMYMKSSCRSLKMMKDCLYRQKCTEHYQLFENYYTNSCLNITCYTRHVMICDGSPADDTIEGICRNLEEEYQCVLKKRIYPNNVCKMPVQWETDYESNTCEHPCYNISKPNLSRLPDEYKCKALNSYKSNLDSLNCKMPDDMEKEYKSSKCDTYCNREKKCIITISYGDSRKLNCHGLSVGIKCLETAKCPVSQYIHDAYAFYGCDSSCNGNVLTECMAILKEPLNSTREELCGYFREERGCYDKAKCEMSDLYMKLLECSGAASRNTMFAVIIPVLLAVQMLEKYISLF
ncbi:uncharacterized protein LOC115212988 [Octopus sinensis]|uniref:Uncharacterized protein LOC115212988 n=1 Tax=Octopus sinensis TaxID=2607531 RepID=A0A6P7SH23_9MOLL|nr:uncharacterized protein LOC115212988 [Octopus sinensis]